MRFLHLADIHLDTLFAGRTPPLRTRLRDASREALRRAFRLARNRSLDAILLAGDLFDGERLSFQTERFLGEELSELDEAGIPVFYATGNHDPGDGILDGDRLEWPANVTLFRHQEPQVVEVKREGETVGRVTGAGHATSRVSEDLSLRFPSPTRADELPHIAVLHTQVTGAGGAGEHDRYAPSELPHLLRAGFDYWALGHIHLRQELSSLPGIHFPGNLQGRHPGETGAKGGLVVEIPRKGVAPAVEFVELAPVRWETLEVDGLEEASTLAALTERIRDGWETIRGADPGRPGTEWIVRVVLVGPSPLHALLRDPAEEGTLVEVLTSELGVLGVEVRSSRLRPVVDPARYTDRQDAAGAALRLVQSLAGWREGSDEDSPSVALDLSTGELAGGPSLADDPALDDYLRELLEDGDRLLLDRFLGGEEEG